MEGLCQNNNLHDQHYTFNYRKERNVLALDAMNKKKLRIFATISIHKFNCE